MKRIHFLQILLCVCLWHSHVLGQTLEIHQINVGAADSGVIIVRDTTKLRDAVKAFNPAYSTSPRLGLLKTALDNNVSLTGTVLKAVLIDAAENGAEYASKIKRYLTKLGVSSLDFAVVSHWDKDHMGGFYNLSKKNGITPPKVYMPRTNADPKPSGKTWTEFTNVIKPTMREVAVPNNTEIDLGTYNGKAIKMTCVAADGLVLREADYGTKSRSSRVAPNNKNDASVCWLIQYGAFRFYTGGDLNGHARPGASNDVETLMVDALATNDASDFRPFGNVGGPQITAGHVCAIKLNHHGSEHSTNTHFIDVLKPEVAFISCGDKHQHPRGEAVKKLDDGASIKNYYVTSFLKNFGNKRGLYNKVKHIGDTGKKGIIGGDLTIVVDDANIDTKSRFVVLWNGNNDTPASNKNFKTPTAKGTKPYGCHEVGAGGLTYITNH